MDALDELRNLHYSERHRVGEILDRVAKEMDTTMDVSTHIEELEPGTPKPPAEKMTLAVIDFALGFVYKVKQCSFRLFVNFYRQ